MNTILCVTNEKFVGASFFSRFKERTDVTIVNEKQGHITATENNFSEWKTVTDDVEYDNYITDGMLVNTYNITYLSYPAFAYVVARERFFNDATRKFCVVTMRETHQTRIISGEFYNFLINTKFHASFSMFQEFFADINGNELLSEMFDPVYEDILEGRIPLMSDNVQQYL